MTKTLTTIIVVISIFLNSISYTGFEIGTWVIGICLLFGVWDLLFTVYLSILILDTAKGCGVLSAVVLKYWPMTYPLTLRGSN